MDSLYDQVLRSMERTLHSLAGRVPEPKKVPFKDSFVYRHVEKSVHQALVQKLARCISTLHSARLLMENGFVQEQGALQRMLDEMNEDTKFLSFGVMGAGAGDIGARRTRTTGSAESSFPSPCPIEGTDLRRRWLGDDAGCHPQG